MAGDTPITIVGNLTADPELRFTPSGVAVAKFRIASTPRSFNKSTNSWEDGETLFLDCNVWRQAAENAAESLMKGTRVLVHGRLKSRSYVNKEDQKRTVIELEVDSFGPDLVRATAQVTKNPYNGAGDNGGSVPAAAVPVAADDAISEEAPF